MIVGILGGGQLARMLALAGHRLGARFVFLDPAADACAAPLGEHLKGEFDDPGALARLAARVDVVTFEFESVPAQSAREIARRVPVFPPPDALAVAQDRLLEKQLFGRLGIPTPEYAAVESRAELERLLARIGLPAMLKTRTHGYDGKGQAVLREARDAAVAWERMKGAPAIVERLVAFEREVSIIAVRGRRGETAFYPLADNTHRDGILWLSMSRPRDRMQARAEDYARRLLEALDYAGVLALELFETEGMLLANEFAPRVHNSGHWTIEGAETSQFENHLRAILGLPLGDTAARGDSAMVNLIGVLPQAADVLAVPGAHLHVYGKQPRPERKLGHVTVRRDSLPALGAALERLLGLCDGPIHKP